MGDRIALVIPARDEAKTIGDVVAAFRRALPGAEIVVADNGSSDATAEEALAAGARVLHERRAGKGEAVRRLFAEVDADCYLMVDGDGTYDANSAPELVAPVLRGEADMVIGHREAVPLREGVFPLGHRFGNRLLTWFFRSLFDAPIADALSGYRAMSRRFVKTFPFDSRGFEIEIEMDVHAAVLRAPVIEIPTPYAERPDGSQSKLRTFRDGWRIARRNLRLFRDARPALAFSVLAAPWALLAFWLVGIAVVEYLETGFVARFPSLIVGVGAFVISSQLWIAGLILERVARNRRQTVRLAYLNFPPLPTGAR